MEGMDYIGAGKIAHIADFSTVVGDVAHVSELGRAKFCSAADHGLPCMRE